jgi:[CysO sulfur-carrier protein]-S-L-cysteine hydrolase
VVRGTEREWLPEHGRRSGVAELVDVPKWLLERMLEAAEKEPWHEVCGLVLFRRDRITRMIPIPNKSTKDHDFEMDNAHLIAALQSMEQRDEQIWGVYHSHPEGPGELSPVDIEFASLPAYYLVVVPGRNGMAGEVRCWRILGTAAEEVEMQEYSECVNCGGRIYVS